MLYSLNPFEYMSATLAEDNKIKEMTSPEKVTRRILSIPLIHSILSNATFCYQKTKDKMQPLSGLFDWMEDMAREATKLSNQYVATPLANKAGGWKQVDDWGCQMLDKLEIAVTKLKGPTRKVKESFYSNLRSLLEVHYSGDESDKCIFEDSCEEGDNEVETYDTVCHGKNLPDEEIDTESVNDPIFHSHDDLRTHVSSSLTIDQRASSSSTPKQRLSQSQGSSENTDNDLSPWWKRVFRMSKKGTHRESPEGKNKVVDIKKHTIRSRNASPNESHDSRNTKESNKDETMDNNASLISDIKDHTIPEENELKSRVLSEVNSEREDLENFMSAQFKTPGRDENDTKDNSRDEIHGI